MNFKKAETIIEFLIFGIIIGITEDLMAIKLATHTPITWRIIGIIILIAVPFAVLAEIVFAKLDFEKIMARLFRKKD